MFDRIAGVYDLMNSAMTAGMHHRWRERAADRAELGAGRRGARRLLRHRRPGARAARRVGAGGPGRRLRLLRADARPRAREGGRARRRPTSSSSGPTRSSSPTTTRASTRSRSASASATSPTSTRGIAEMARVLKPGGRLVILEITQPQRPPLSTFFSLWFDRLVPLLGTLAGDRDAYSYLPESVQALPAARGPGGDHGRAPGSSGSATRSSPAGSSRSTPARAAPRP